MAFFSKKRKEFYLTEPIRKLLEENLEKNNSIENESLIESVGVYWMTRAQAAECIIRPDRIFKTGVLSKGAREQYIDNFKEARENLLKQIEYMKEEQ